MPFASSHQRRDWHAEFWAGAQAGSVVSGCDGAAYLDARDARDARAARLVDRTRSRRGSVVWLTVNIPGPDKRRPGVDDIFIRALQAVLTWSGAESLDQGVDLLGPFAAILVPGDPAAVKRAAVALEEDGPERRLIDIDVCDEAGVPVDRARLGLPQRPCLVCPEPARDCIRRQRNAPHALAAAVSALLPGTGQEVLIERADPDTVLLRDIG